MKPPFMRTPFNYDTNKASDESGLECKDPTLAQQQFKDECDINVLFARYLESGEMPQVINSGLSYGDFTGIFDFQTAMNAVRTAEGVFQQLPAKIKNRFDNDPQKLLAWVNNDDNYDEAVFLGLIKKPDTLPEPNAGLQEKPNDTGTQGVPRATEKEPQGHRGAKASTTPPAGTEKP